MIEVRRIDHLAIAVRSLAKAAELFGNVLGGEFLVGADNEQHGMRTLLYRFPGGMKIELLQPLRQDSSVGRFLDRRGEGVHHVTLYVADVAAAADELRRNGYEVVGLSTGTPRWEELYLRPVSAFGTLLQLASSSLRHDEPYPGVVLEDVLRGDWVWTNVEPVRRARAHSPVAERPS